MYYAPIYIPTLCRYKHLRRSLESLKKNSWAQYTDVYIALDYPSRECHWEGYRKICDYLENEDFSIFSKFVVVKRMKNYGADNNTCAMCEEIMKMYDRWIFAEDDIVYSHNFLEYMDKCLDFFEKDDHVLAINGYAYPLEWKLAKNATVLKQSATFSAWGVGFWKEKYLLARKEIGSGYLRSNFKRAVNEGILTQMISGRYCDYVVFTLSGMHEGLYYKMSDVAIGIYLKLKNMVVITPSLTKTKNFGFDGTGVYCENLARITGKNSMEYDYNMQPIDMDEHIEIILDEEVNSHDNEQLLDDFLYVDKFTKCKVKILMILYHILGLEKCMNIYQKLKSLLKRMV